MQIGIWRIDIETLGKEGRVDVSVLVLVQARDRRNAVHRYRQRRKAKRSRTLLLQRWIGN